MEEEVRSGEEGGCWIVCLDEEEGSLGIDCKGHGEEVLWECQVRFLDSSSGSLRICR